MWEILYKSWMSKEVELCTAKRSLSSVTNVVINPVQVPTWIFTRWPTGKKSPSSVTSATTLHPSYLTLNHNKKLHNGEWPFLCNQCAFSAARSLDLRRHVQTEFKCNKCDQVFHLLDDVKTHKIIHSGKTAIKCNQCEYFSAYPHSLKIHMLTHSGEKTFKCEECGHSCATSTYLRRHMMTHTGEKSFKCNQCNYSSYSSGNVKIHMHTHRTKSL